MSNTQPSKSSGSSPDEQHKFQEASNRSLGQSPSLNVYASNDSTEPQYQQQHQFQIQIQEQSAQEQSLPLQQQHQQQQPVTDITVIPSKGEKFRRIRKYHHLTCSNCRKRKAKCDGLLPICTTCKSFGDYNCIYDKPASIAYVRHLEKLVRDFTEYVGLFNLPGIGVFGSDGTSTSNHFNFAKENFGNISTIDFKNIETHLKAENQQFPFKGGIDISSSPSASQPVSGSPQDPSIQKGLNKKDLDELFELSNGAPNFSEVTEQFRIDHLKSVAKKTAELEESALRSILQTNFSYIPLSTAKKCLQFYWSWIDPINLTVHHSSFVKGAVSYTSSLPHNPENCFSLALLAVMLSESFPILYGKDSGLSKILSQHAYSLLMREILLPATFATVTAALNMAIFALRQNNFTQVSVFTGIAYRIAQDLDLFSIPDAQNPTISIESVEVRSRLSWALFFWDQTISFYMDRLPSIPKPLMSFEKYIIDSNSDESNWQPVIDLKSNKVLSSELLKDIPKNYFVFPSLAMEKEKDIFASSGSSISLGKMSRTDNSESLDDGIMKPSLKRTASGTFKVDVKGKSISKHDGNYKSFNNVSNTTASFKLRLEILEVLYDTHSLIFGYKMDPLVFHGYNFYDPPPPSATIEVTAKVRKKLKSLVSFWSNVPNELKISGTFPPPAEATVNPTNVANCLQYNGSLVWFYTVLGNLPKDNSDLHLDGFSGDVEGGLSAVFEIIRALIVYINIFGELRINHWHEHAPFIAAKYLLELLTQEYDFQSDQRDRALKFLKILMKLLQRPAFQVPKSAETLRRINAMFTPDPHTSVSPQKVQSPLNEQQHRENPIYKLKQEDPAPSQISMQHPQTQFSTPIVSYPQDNLGSQQALFQLQTGNTQVPSSFHQMPVGAYPYVAPTQDPSTQLQQQQHFQQHQQHFQQQQHLQPQQQHFQPQQYQQYFYSPAQIPAGVNIHPVLLHPSTALNPQFASSDSQAIVPHVLYPGQVIAPGISFVPHVPSQQNISPVGIRMLTVDTNAGASPSGTASSASATPVSDPSVFRVNTETMIGATTAPAGHPIYSVSQQEHTGQKPGHSSVNLSQTIELDAFPVHGVAEQPTERPPQFGAGQQYVMDPPVSQSMVFSQQLHHRHFLPASGINPQGPLVEHKHTQASHQVEPSLQFIPIAPVHSVANAEGSYNFGQMGIESGRETTGMIDAHIVPRVTGESLTRSPGSVKSIEDPDKIKGSDQSMAIPTTHSY